MKNGRLLQTRVAAAFILACVAWSTTPLAVKLSIAQLDPLTSLYYRFTGAALLGWLAMLLFRVPMGWKKEDIRAYGYVCCTLCLGMGIAYFGFREVPSGLGGVIFGMAPLLSAVLERICLGGPTLSRGKLIICLFGLAGLCTILIGQQAADPSGMSTSANTTLGFSLLVLAMVIFNLGAVLIRYHYSKAKTQPNPLVISVGGFLFASIVLGIIMLATRSTITLADPLYTAGNTALWSSIGAILYLSIVGSLLGFGCYNYVSLRASVQTASVVNMITPALALLLGAKVLHEQLNAWEFGGAGVVIASVCLYFCYDPLRKRFKSNQLCQHH